MFEGIVGNIGELRTDITTGTVYRYNGTEWIVNGTGVSSSATFPTTGITVGDIREDIKTGGKFRWNGTTWVLITKAGDTDGDGIPDTVEDGGITTNKIADGAVDGSKLAELSVDNVHIANSAVNEDKLANSAVSTDKINKGVLQVSTTTITSAEILALNATPKELIAAPGVGKVVVVDKVIATMDYATTAYTTNTTLEVRYGTATTKVSADITGLLTATEDKTVSVGGIETELVNAINDNIELNVGSGEALSGDSDIKITVVYRVLSI